MNEDEASYYSRNFSIGSEQELDSLSAIQSVNVSQNTVNTFLPAENQDMDDYFPDSYKVGGVRPPHHGYSHQDYDQNQTSSQGHSHHDLSVEMSHFADSPVRRLKKKVPLKEEGNRESAPPAYHRELSDAYIDSISRTPRYNSGRYRTYDEMIPNMSEGDPFRGNYQPSGKKPIGKDRDKFMKEQKSNTARMFPPPAQQSGDSVFKIHKKKKKKHKHGGMDSNESTGTYVINGKTNQAYTSLPEATDLDNASDKRTGAYASSRNHKSSIGDKDYHGEEIPKSMTAMSAAGLVKSPSRINTRELKKIQDILSKTASDIDKDALADFINEMQIKQRECHSYVRKENGNRNDCQCGRDKEWHGEKGLQMHSSGTKRIWHMKTHTLESPCDSFGEIKFIGFGNETENSPYIRVCPKTDLESLWTIMIEHWKLPFPKLLISVTGGAQIFNLTPKHQLIFKRGLMNAATTTGAWIITGGMATGVMKFVGEAVRDHILTKGTSDKSIVALGIATWGCVANRENLDGEGDRGLWPAFYSSADLGETKERDVPLDHNHTHFILVDDGSIKKYGVEIELGAELEKFISKKIDTGVAETQSVDLPVVKIVVEGGVNTMKTVWKSATEDIPVLVLQGSGRAADFIAYGYNLSKDKSDEEKSKFTKDFDDLLKNEASNVFVWKEKDSNKEEKIEECVRQLKNILANKRKMVNVFNLNEADKDIDRAILYALLKANKSNASAQLALALAWNRSDIARNEIFTHSNREHWKNIPLYDAMFTALVQDRVDFIQLFLDCGVSFSRFLSIDTLWNLYACSLLDHSDSSAQLLAQLMMYRGQSWSAYLCCRQPENFGTEPNLLNSVGKIIVYLLGDESMNLYSDTKFIVKCTKPEQKWFPGNHEKKQAEGNQQHFLSHHMSVDTGKTSKRKRYTYDFEHPEKELFIWAILFNRGEMAKMLWKMSKNQIAGALVACALLKNMAARADDEEELELSVNLAEHSQKYEDLATAVLGECYRKDKQLAHQLVVRRLNMYGRTTLFTLADANVLMKFMGHTCCQTKLNLIWKGRMAQYTQSWKILISIIFPIMIPLIKFTSNQALVDLQDKYDALMEGEEVEEQPKEEVAKNQVKPKNVAFKDQDQEAEVFARSKTRRKKHGKKRLYNVTMFTDASTNTIGLLSAIYYFYTAPITVFIIYNIAYLIFLAIFTYFVLTDLTPDKPSVLEYITWGWTVTMLIEEFRQIVSRDQRSILFKIRSWFSGIWNRFDLLMYVLFLVSVIARYALSEDQFTWARITYSITLGMYYLRFMQVFFVEKNIGPKVIMIKNMIVDLMFFVLIFLIFLLSFGVAYQANLFPNSEPSWFLLKSVVYMPYWQMYGELFLDDMTGKPPDGCDNNETIWRAAGGQGRCPAENALVPLLGAIYVILTNILLINLLIAMFSYTFQQVQEQSENVWRFYRFSLVHEYYDRPFLCPPLIIFNHLFRLLLFVLRKCGCNSSKTFNEFKLELNDKDNNRLTLFEKSALEEYWSCSQRQELESVDKKVATTHERLERVIEDLDNIKESVKLQEDLATHKFRERTQEGMDSADDVSVRVSSRMVSTDVKNDTEEMQIHLYELGNQVAQNSSHINQMMQMLQQILRNQERNMRTPYLEISDISPSADA